MNLEMMTATRSATMNHAFGAMLLKFTSVPIAMKNKELKIREYGATACSNDFACGNDAMMLPARNAPALGDKPRKYARMLNPIQNPSARNVVISSLPFLISHLKRYEEKRSMMKYAISSVLNAMIMCSTIGMMLASVLFWRLEKKINAMTARTSSITRTVRSNGVSCLLYSAFCSKTLTMTTVMEKDNTAPAKIPTIGSYPNNDAV